MKELPDDIVQAAQAAAEKYGIPTSVTLAQYILESDWGADTPAGSNNPFGIKALKGQPFVLSPTHEDVGHRLIPIKAAFRKFDSIADAFDDHARLLAEAPAYAPARAKLPDVIAFVKALTGVYATDENYGTELIGVIKGDALQRYDVAVNTKTIVTESV